ncbi:hypothetical protein [Pseudoalteromonas luteoviolacea]|uniref:Uncharacterized protein n=1 Tax=Pseudoalteromonas luteoviolacea NCIMB 1942 TaxID=1365253 RepID=A0A167B004_9GAMM|nr:hypothetical protein [Pseudoalteromonas luteoviolacea]KZN46001.1 hypothetical protein N482_13050 [Pseudoalteromonas luteoviolacea NCIMB 1942]
MDKNLIKWGPWVIGLGVAYYVFSKARNTVEEAVDTVGKPIGGALAELQFLINGSHAVTSSYVGFVLDSEKLDENYKVKDMLWYEGISKLNEGNDAMLREIFDRNKVLKPQYIVLLDGEVNPEILFTINKA